MPSFTSQVCFILCFALPNDAEVMKMGTTKICKSGPQWVDHLDTDKFTIWTTIYKSDGSNQIDRFDYGIKYVRKFIKGILKPEVLMFDLYVQPWRIFRIVCRQALHSPQDALWIGRIVDYGFTVAFNPMFHHLREASQEATNIGIL
ncbi:unnamed protein product [Camellia sinensis]